MHCHMCACVCTCAYAYLRQGFEGRYHYEFIVVAPNSEGVVIEGAGEGFGRRTYMHMHACTCMHMHAHAYTCMHAHACTCIQVSRGFGRRTYMHMHACTCMHMHAHACTCIQVSRGFGRRTYMHACMLACACARAHTHACMRMHAYAHACMHMHTGIKRLFSAELDAIIAAHGERVVQVPPIPPPAPPMTKAPASCEDEARGSAGASARESPRAGSQQISRPEISFASVGAITAANDSSNNDEPNDDPVLTSLAQTPRQAESATPAQALPYLTDK